MRPNDKLAVICVQLHACDVRVEYILKHSDGFTGPCIPYFNRFFPRDINFKPDRRKLCARDRVVIRLLLHKRLVVLENLEISASANEPSVLGHGPDTSHLVHVCHIESLNAAVVEYAPHFNHAFGVGGDETIQGANAVHAD